MFKRLHSEHGFTLIEMLMSLVILSVIVGSVAQVSLSSTKMINSQSYQLDLRTSSRQVLSRIEKEVQASNSIDIVLDQAAGQNVQKVDLFDASNPPFNFKTINFDPATNSIQLITHSKTNPDVTQVLAKYISSVVGTPLAAVPGNVIHIPGDQETLSLVVRFTERDEVLQIHTSAVPRLNVQNVKSIISVKPNVVFTNNQIHFDQILAQNTNFTSSSVVSLREGSNIYASSQSLTRDDSVTLSNINLTTTGGDFLPFGFYDLYVSTPISGQDPEIVWAPSAVTCQWDYTKWLPTAGTWDSSGWRATNFPYVVKNNSNNNQKSYSYTAKPEGLNFDVKMSINLTAGWTNTGQGPDAEIGLWTNDSGNGAHGYKYIGFGIDQSTVYLRTVNYSPTLTVKIPNKIYDPEILPYDSHDPYQKQPGATLEAKAVNGVLSLYVNGEYVNNQFINSTDASKIINYFAGGGSGFQNNTLYTSTVVRDQNQVMVKYMVIRL